MSYLNAQLGKQGRDNYICQIEKTGWQVCDGCDAYCSRHLEQQLLHIPIFLLRFGDYPRMKIAAVLFLSNQKHYLIEPEPV